MGAGCAGVILSDAMGIVNRMFGYISLSLRASNGLWKRSKGFCLFIATLDRAEQMF
jgi:hypothetical protein